MLAFRLLSKNKLEAFRLAGQICYIAHNEEKQVICNCQMYGAGGIRAAIELMCHIFQAGRRIGAR